MRNHTLISKQNIVNGNSNASFQVTIQMLTALWGEPEYVSLKYIDGCEKIT